MIGNLWWVIYLLNDQAFLDRDTVAPKLGWIRTWRRTKSSFLRISWTVFLLRGFLTDKNGFLFIFRSSDTIWDLNFERVDLNSDIFSSRSVDVYIPLSKFGSIRPSVEACIPFFLNSDRFDRLWIPAFPFKNLDQIGHPLIPASLFEIRTKSVVRWPLYYPTKTSPNRRSVDPCDPHF